MPCTSLKSGTRRTRKLENFLSCRKTHLKWIRRRTSSHLEFIRPFSCPVNGKVRQKNSDVNSLQWIRINFCLLHLKKVRAEFIWVLKVIRVLLWFSFARAVFNFACHWSKTKTKLIALTNHSGRKQHRNQLELEAKTCDGGQVTIDWVDFWLVEQIVGVVLTYRTA